MSRGVGFQTGGSISSFGSSSGRRFHFFILFINFAQYAGEGSCDRALRSSGPCSRASLKTSADADRVESAKTARWIPALSCGRADIPAAQLDPIKTVATALATAAVNADLNASRRGEMNRFGRDFEGFSRPSSCQAPGSKASNSDRIIFRRLPERRPRLLLRPETLPLAAPTQGK